MRKAISLLLAAMMLFALPLTSFGAAPAKPEVSIAVNNIKDETMEVAIRVGAGNFKSVGAVLEYDASKVTPMRWSTSAAIAVHDNGTSPAAMGWANATVIESVCPDNLSGKPAMAYKSGNTGYLYLGAEAAAAQTFAAETQVVTVRFAYVGDTKFDAASATVKFAQDDKVAFASPVKGSMIYQTEDRATGDYKFYYLNPLTETDGVVGTDPSVPEGDKIPPTPPATNEDGETANKGEANPDDFVSLTFYDWDNTLLGTRIVAKGGSLIDPNTTSNRAIYINLDGSAKYTDAELAAKGVAPVAPQGQTLSGGNDTSGVAITAKNKAGYEYAGWVDYTDDSTPKVAVTVSVDSSIPADAIVSLSGITTSKIIRAAYNEKGIGTASLTNRRYTISASPFKMDSKGTFLETTITVVRKETSRRINSDAVLVIALSPKGTGETQIKVNLGDSDVETYVLTMTPGANLAYEAEAIICSLRDAEGTTRGTGIRIQASDIVEH